MITIESPPHQYELKDYESFVQVVQAIDDFLGTKTYIFSGTLKQINDNFFQRNIHQCIVDEVNNLFKHKNTIYSNDTGLIHRDLEKINSLDYILSDLSSGVKIKNPLSLNYFKTSQWGTHPGNTRLLFSNYYTDTVISMVTDYKRTVEHDYPHLHFSELEDVSFSVDEVSILLNNTIKGPNTIRIPAGKNIIYKELTDNPSAELGNPTLYDPPRWYQLKNDIVYVCDRPTVEKVNGEWQIYKR